MWVQRFVSVGEFTNLFELSWSSISNRLAHDILQLEGSCLSLPISSACYREECAWELKHGWVIEGWLHESFWVMSKISQVLHTAGKDFSVFCLLVLIFLIRNKVKALTWKTSHLTSYNYGRALKCVWCTIGLFKCCHICSPKS